MTTARGSTEVRRRRGSAEVRNGILSAARAEFEHYGFRDTGLQAVAERARVAPSVLYRNFETKLNLYAAAVLDPFIQGLEKLGDDWLEQSVNGLPDSEGLRRAIADTFRYLTSHASVLEQIHVSTPDLHAQVLQRPHQAFALLNAKLRLVKMRIDDPDRWLAKQQSETPVSPLLAMIIGMSSSSWLIAPDRSDDDLVSDMALILGVQRPPTEGVPR